MRGWQRTAAVTWHVAVDGLCKSSCPGMKTLSEEVLSPWSSSLSPVMTPYCREAWG